MIHLAPKPGHVYRRTDTKALVGDEGDHFDPCDLDVVRARECGDLLEAGAPMKNAPGKGRRRKSPVLPPLKGGEALEVGQSNAGAPKT
jgi:hypothetical protein